jgi:hypothetical protein
VAVGVPGAALVIISPVVPGALFLDLFLVIFLLVRIGGGWRRTAGLLPVAGNVKKSVVVSKAK